MTVLPGSKVKVSPESPKLNILKCWNEVELTATACVPPGIWDYLRVNVHALVVENLQPAEFLKFKKNLLMEVAQGCDKERTHLDQFQHVAFHS
ncbi:sucrose synthase [Medicago truncatula]|uniref:Sucrose synthase n=1 Tax=Medicago truncatula TaxID=3880 RepID=A0A072U504_MEDTR|nr:sucrose synthase [Medicago truncatula]